MITDIKGCVCSSPVLGAVNMDAGTIHCRTCKYAIAPLTAVAIEERDEL